MSGEMELKPCPSPWCKESAPELQQGGFRNGHFRVECQNCFTKGPTRDDLNGGGPAAIAAWNARTPTPTAVSVEAVAKVIRESLEESVGPSAAYADEYAVARAVLAALSIPREDGVTELLDALEAIKELADADETFLCWKTANDALESYTAMRDASVVVEGR